MAGEQQPTSRRRRSTTRAATVPTAQYADGVGWKVGDKAPTTVYADADGKLTEQLPEGMGRVIVQEGAKVTRSVLRTVEEGGGVAAFTLDGGQTSLDGSGSATDGGAKVPNDGAGQDNVDGAGTPDATSRPVTDQPPPPEQVDAGLVDDPAKL